MINVVTVYAGYRYPQDTGLHRIQVSRGYRSPQDTGIQRIQVSTGYRHLMYNYISGYRQSLGMESLGKHGERSCCVSAAEDIWRR